MTSGEFMFGESFVGLPESAVLEAILQIETNWMGVMTLWGQLPVEKREAKRRLCENYLVAWLLADMHPTCTRGIFNNNGAPIRSKDIGGTLISFNQRKVQADLEPLTTNIYGLNALEMIATCPDRYFLR